MLKNKGNKSQNLISNYYILLYAWDYLYLFLWLKYIIMACTVHLVQFYLQWSHTRTLKSAMGQRGGIIFTLFKLATYIPEQFAPRYLIAKYLIFRPSITYIFIHVDIHLNKNFTLLHSIFYFILLNLIHFFKKLAMIK